MPEHKGKLIQKGGKFYVDYKESRTKKPVELKGHNVIQFSSDELKDGLEVVVKVDALGVLILVRLPNQPKPLAKPKKLFVDGFASPSIVGSPFNNPYTFLPFNDEPFEKRSFDRIQPTTLSVDETLAEFDRMTGVLDLTITTTSPLMTCLPQVNRDAKTGHKVLKAMIVGNDVVVPATGVRGALRTLMTVLTGGTLGYVDDTAYLIQGRDLQLEPDSRSSDKMRPLPDLGQVVELGSALKPGKIQLGETRPVLWKEVESLFAKNRSLLNSKQLKREHDAAPIWIGLDSAGKLARVSTTRSDSTPWRLRLSGPPVGNPPNKREGIFRPNGKIVEVPQQLWADYLHRHVTSVHSELRSGDLVWLEPKTSVYSIEDGEDIQSLQWARWGRKGEKLEERIPKVLHPDSWNPDGKVDEVTNLFGQVRDKRCTSDDTLSFAARVRPENLVFQDAAAVCVTTVLAPLMMPHPGCLAFYRVNPDPNQISKYDQLRGYKVYRTSAETGASGPWNYAQQGVYDQGKLKPAQQDVNQTVDLLPPGRQGTLRISFRALSKRELALLVYSCEQPWRLGGGKPLGLGACNVQLQQIIDEDGQTYQPADLLGGESWRDQWVTDIKPRAKAWTATQQPVPKLRYPRAMKQRARGGHAWFTTHATPSKGDGQNGLQPIHIAGNLLSKAKETGQPIDERDPKIHGQVLPHFDADAWQTDLLFGYDLEEQINREGRINHTTDFTPIDESQGHTHQGPRGENNSPNQQTRQQNRQNRE